MRGIGLENSDYELIEETVLAAISEDAEIGTETSWRNEETGAVGTVTVKEISKEGRCVSFDLLVRPSHAGDVRAFQSRRCLGADGTWRLSLE
jgi:surface antigen